MKTIIKVPAVREKKYRVPTVAQLLGMSENSIYGFFSNKHIPTKGGITVYQVIDFLESRYEGATRDTGAIDWTEMRELKAELLRRGYQCTDIDEDEVDL